MSSKKSFTLPKGWKHGDVVDVPISLLKPNPWNPNEMTAGEFNLLSENIDAVDFLDPVLAVPLEDGSLRIIDGEHRYEAQRLRDAPSVKVVLCDSARVDETMQKLQTVRMNKIKGSLNQKKFSSLVTDLMKTGEYTYDQLAHELGFADEDEFQHLIAAARDSLPSKEMKNEFDKAKDQIKTVDDLSSVLNHLFTKYGDTLPYNFMILDFGGKEHMWVRMRSSAHKKVVAQARNCMENGVTFDSVVSHILTLMDVKKFVGKWRDQLEAPKPGEDVPGIDQLTEEEADE
jgi:hypothetical protein